MSEGLPDGWDEERIRRVEDYYDRHAVGEMLRVAHATKRSNYALVQVPKPLLGKVRRLVAEYEREERGGI